MDRSFLLLKPDAVRQGLLGTARRTVAEHGGAVAEERTARIERADLEFLWPLSFDSHPLTMDLLEHYVCDQDLPLLIVTGADPVAIARSAKRELRRRFARGILANVVHAADDEVESAEQLRLLAVPPGPARSRGRRSAGFRHRGADLKAMGFDDAELRAATAAYLREWDAGDGVDPEPAGAGTHIVLLDDRINTLDSAVAGLLAVFPGLGLHRAIRIVMTVDARGSAVVADCRPEHWPVVHQRMADAGLPNAALSGAAP